MKKTLILFCVLFITSTLFAEEKEPIYNKWVTDSEKELATMIFKNAEDLVRELKKIQNSSTGFYPQSEIYQLPEGSENLFAIVIPYPEYKPIFGFRTLRMEVFFGSDLQWLKIDVNDWYPPELKSDKYHSNPDFGWW